MVSHISRPGRIPHRGTTAAGWRSHCAGDGLQVAVTGSAAVTAATNISDTTSVLLISLVIIGVILLLVYRSAVLWLLSLLGSVVAYDVAKAAAYGMARAGLTVSSLSADILIILVLGVSTDYALLLIHRYRAELRCHVAAADAMAGARRGAANGRVRGRYGYRAPSRGSLRGRTGCR
jgi:uncharacterized membrane protein YdfJ with MMPL/SSD domain